MLCHNAKWLPPLIERKPLDVASTQLDQAGTTVSLADIPFPSESPWSAQ